MREISHEASVFPENTLAYTVKASFSPAEAGELPRIGQRGTAKVYGETVSLGYYLLRKPILLVRKSVGL